MVLNVRMACTFFILFIEIISFAVRWVVRASVIAVLFYYSAIYALIDGSNVLEVY